MAANTIRAFLAAELAGPQSDWIRDRLAGARRDLDGVRWVPEENWHLTLRFLGDITTEASRALVTRLDESLRQAEPFELALSPAGCFPHRRRARVLWVGVEPRQPLCTAQARIEEVVTELQIAPPERRRFHAHVTVGRGRGRLSRAALDRFLNAFEPPLPSPATVDRVHLYASRLTPEGARYRVVESIGLGV